VPDGCVKGGVLFSLLYSNRRMGCGYTENGVGCGEIELRCHIEATSRQGAMEGRCYTNVPHQE